MKRKLVLENGLVFLGEGFGSSNEVVAELTFNTSVVGYQEILSDPANYKQMICMSYPVIGSYGLTDEDYESKGITAAAVICREYNDEPSNFRYTHKLGEVMDDEGIPGISEVDTREIVRIIRDNGTMKALICDANKPMAECMKMIVDYNQNQELSMEISSKKVWYSRTTNPLFTVVAIDCGIKKSIVRLLNMTGCNVVVLPQDSTVEEVLKHKPTGLFISDGPGNPMNNKNTIELIRALKGTMPILGVGMGQELIALAYGAKVFKEKVGHHGSNLPVRCISTGKIEITTQNDLYAVYKESLADTGLAITHENVIDFHVMGISDIENNVIAIKYSPADNIKDRSNAFNRFACLMKGFGGKDNAKKNRY